MKNVLKILVATMLPVSAAVAEPSAYESPDAAVQAVINALEASDKDALLAVFGPEQEDMLFSGNDVQDREDWTSFMTAYKEMHRIGVEGDKATLFIGTDQYPTVIPIVRGDDGKWRFDSDAGREEIIDRRIGSNELDVIELLRRYVEVQANYRAIDYDGDGVMEFANTILSDPGKRNGLHWPDEPGVPASPIGDFVARASAQGYSVDGTEEDAQPYLGYYFRILDKQGADAPGGALDYVVNGNMIAGHALIAFPSDHGGTGIMTFMVGENGIVYEADLGDDTLEKAAAIDAYNPDDGWSLLD